MKLQMLLLVALLPLTAGAAPAAPDDVKTGFAQLVQTVESLDDYQVRMSRQQRIDGELGASETVLLKHRRTPECRYMQWLDGKSQGREILQCAAVADGKLRIHEPGLFGLTLTLAPDSPMIRKRGNLRSPTDSGLFNMARKVREEAHEGHDPSSIEATRTEIAETPALCVERAPAPQPEDPYPVGKRKICLRQDNGLPVLIEMWNTDGELMERYGFSDYRLNAGFTDEDFSESNPDYDF